MNACTMVEGAADYTTLVNNMNSMIARYKKEAIGGKKIDDDKDGGNKNEEPLRLWLREDMDLICFLNIKYCLMEPVKVFQFACHNKSKV